MRAYFIAAAATLIFSCNQTDKTTGDTNKKTDSAISQNAPTVVNDDSTVINISAQVISCLKQKDFTCLAGFVHPLQPVRFSPYVNVDSSTNKTFSNIQIANFGNEKTKINWGPYDAGADDIIMTPADYFKSFVYDIDYDTVTQKNLNKITNRGTLPNNLAMFYPGDKYVEYFNPGKDPKFDGMDWTSLNLVFRKIDGKYYLVAIAHGSWTT